MKQRMQKHEPKAVFPILEGKMPEIKTILHNNKHRAVQ
jgi:hypothetical protein